MSACRSCGAEIRFVKTTSGSTMPLDLEPHEDGNVHIANLDGRDVAQHVNQSGRTVARALGRPLYRSHFATCPNADEHRKRPA